MRSLNQIKGANRELEKVDDVQRVQQHSQLMLALLLAEQKRKSYLAMPLQEVYSKYQEKDFVIPVLVDRQEGIEERWAKQLDCEMGCWRKG
jgi:hypothetical protein